ncbi:MAG: RnfH family protein [Gammaproteobacteria bacterium]|nr:RnfH family protein [Gammaproteobacteria bacterium]
MLLANEPKRCMVKALLDVQVVYALPGNILVIDCSIPAGSTVAEAIHLSGLKLKVPDLCLDEGLVGIYSQKVSLDHTVTDGDRIECYRSVTADPKAVRRRRVEKKRKKS